MPVSVDNTNWSTLWSHSSLRGLGERPTSPLGSFSPAGSHAILCVGVACASLSLLAALISLRWFLLIRRSYRHHLILFLILSDTWKSLWYFVFPIVVLTRGKVNSSSDFCQASGFLLSLGLESSDFAILMIALDTILYVFKRPQIKGEGGLYPYRKYIYPLWLSLPLLSAGLAFTNSREGYITSGTFCYLPKRPFWYRLALAWVPRYLIFITIFAMYAAIFFRVNKKFRGFNDLGDSSRDASGSGSRNFFDKSQSLNSSKALDFGPAGKQRDSQLATTGVDPFEITERPSWEDVSFFAAGSSSTDTQVASRHMSIHSASESRKQSEVPTLGTTLTDDTVATESTIATIPDGGATNTLKSTRSQVRRQLRLLFVYPLVYLLMWTFPFASHCLLYSNYYAAHPPFWLSVVTTASLSLQAGVDCAVFSCRERPWNRIDESSRGSWNSILGLFRKTKERDQSSPTMLVEDGLGKRDSHWWEAEGKKRKDSVWMGTDALNQIITRQDREGRESDMEGGMVDYLCTADGGPAFSHEDMITK
jgi:G protein-coupled receptor GPR1